MSTLFPAFTSLKAAGSRKRIQELFTRSIKSLLLILVPLLSLVIILAPDLLRVWLGQDFASHGVFVLQMLAVGMLVNSLGLIPFGLLQGIGRPDLPAKFSLIELPMYLLGLWFLIHRLGLSGAAIAFTLRCTVDTILLFAAAVSSESVTLRGVLDTGLRRSCVVTLMLIAGLTAVWTASGSPVSRASMSIVLILLFGLGAWSYALDRSERSLLLTTVAEFRNSILRIG
jgi:O-antigen/teichoic acid export membrane protein